MDHKKSTVSAGRSNYVRALFDVLADSQFSNAKNIRVREQLRDEAIGIPADCFPCVNQRVRFVTLIASVHMHRVSISRPTGFRIRLVYPAYA